MNSSNSSRKNTKKDTRTKRKDEFHRQERWSRGIVTTDKSKSIPRKQKYKSNEE